MNKRRAVFICNALDDSTRLERQIFSDSPAASKKTILMAQALSSIGERVVIVSMGRGQTNGSGKYFPAKVKRINGILTLYAPFSHYQVLSQFISLLFLPYLACRLNRFKGKTTAIFYNRTSAYIPSLLVSFFCRYSRVLDLEDGDLPRARWTFYELYLAFKRYLYDGLCSQGTILACTALRNEKSIRNSLCYYGAVENFKREVSWKCNKKIKFLLGGTVAVNTGALALIDAITYLREFSENWCDTLEFIITGKGDCIGAFEALSVDCRPPIVTVMPLLTDIEYIDLVRSCHVGLALKPSLGGLANTTFPSKVIELSSEGLLVLTTNISDVKQVLGLGALYLEDNSSKSIVECIRWIVENPDEAELLAICGQSNVRLRCELTIAGHSLAEFIF
jgi:hypothetical protein